MSGRLQSLLVRIQQERREAAAASQDRR
jgi:hypothetical protein